MSILTCNPTIMSSTTYCNVCDHTFSNTYYTKHIHTKKHINNTKKSKLEKYTIVQLKQICKNKKMTKYSNQSKAELINRISSHMVNIIIRFFKKIKKPIQCDVCMEYNPIVKLCNCTFNICSTCIQSINNENLCPQCRSSHIEYINSLQELTP